jgi:hypothetical protein
MDTDRVKAALTPYGLLVRKSRVDIREYKDLVNTFRPKVGPPRVTKLWSELRLGDVDYYVFPRGYVGAFDTVVMIEQPLPTPAPAPDLFDTQKMVACEIMSKYFTPARVAAGTATCLLNLRAGSGKTFVAAALIAEIGLPAVYLVPGWPLAQQAAKDLTAAMDAEVWINDKPYSAEKKSKKTPAAVGLVSAEEKTHAEPADHRKIQVHILVIHTALKRPAEYFQKFALSIFDEVHSYCSQGRQAIWRKCVCAYALGMSGTTEDRPDTLDVVYYKELAQVRVQTGKEKYDPVLRAENIPGFTYSDMKFPARVRSIKYTGPDSHTQSLVHPSTGKIFTPWMNKQFVADPYRTKYILDALIELYQWRAAGENPGDPERKHRIFVFCEELAPLRDLYEAFRRVFGDTGVDIPECDLGEFVGGISVDKIDSIKTHARVFLTTYGYAGTGVSIVDATAMIFLTPRKANMKQILARIMRRGSDMGIERVIYEIVDARTALAGQHRVRKIAFDFYGMTVERVKVNWESVDPPAWLRDICGKVSQPWLEEGVLALV